MFGNKYKKIVRDIVADSNIIYKKIKMVNPAFDYNPVLIDCLFVAFYDYIFFIKNHSQDGDKVIDTYLSSKLRNFAGHEEDCKEQIRLAHSNYHAIVKSCVKENPSGEGYYQGFKKCASYMIEYLDLDKLNIIYFDLFEHAIELCLESVKKSISE